MYKGLIIPMMKFTSPSLPVMAKYPCTPPEAPISAVNVPPLGAVMRLVVKAVQFVQLGAAVHSLTGSRVRLSGCVVTEYKNRNCHNTSDNGK